MKSTRALDKHLTRSEVAKRLGVSREAVLKNRALGGVKKNGQWYYPEDTVERYRLVLMVKRERRAAKKNDPPVTNLEGEYVARAFAMFENGSSQSDVVIALRLHSAAVRRIWNDWCEMSEEGRMAQHRLEMVKAKLEARRIQLRTEAYREWNQFREKRQQTDLEIASEKRRAAQAYAQAAMHGKRVPREPLSPLGAPKSDAPAGEAT